MIEHPGSPYKGLNAFDDSEIDALLFFGREREREIVVANLIASRLTVLYGPSGVGKSSLLQAAVARSLRELPEEPLVVVFSRWSEDPAVGLAEAVEKAEGGGPSRSNGSPVDALKGAQAGRDVYLVLDQAEEYFLYHADDAGPGSFAEALPLLLAAPLRVNVLVSLREDSLAKLDRFTGRISGLFSNTLRLDRLDRTAARAAIIRPVERYAELTGDAVTVEPELVERVLDEVGAGQIEPALGGLGIVEGSENGARIEAPYLQLVMQRLWEEERASGSNGLRVETLERLGGAQHIVEEHLEGAMAELSPEQKDVAGRLFNHLVTPSGTKIAHEVSDLADFGRVPTDQLTPVLGTLAERRILRSVEEGGDVRYEIFHDVLAQPVLAWRATHEADRELGLQKQASDRRHRRLLAVIAVGAVLFAAMGAVTLYALSQRSEARQQAQEAKAHELEALAAAGLEVDPELSLLLAREAARLAPTQTAEETLRNALLESRIRTFVELDEPLLGAALVGGDVLGATAGGELIVAHGTSGRILRTISTRQGAAHVSLAEDGTALFTGRDGRVRVVGLDGDIARIPGLAGAREVEISPNASLALVLERTGVRLLDVETGAQRRSFAHRDVRSAAISRDNRRVVTGAADETIYLWARTGKRLRALRDNSGHPSALAFTPHAASIAGGSTDGLVRIWSASDGRVTATVAGDATAISDVSFSTDGSHVVTASRDGTVRVAKADTGAPLFVLAGHKDWVTSAAFSGAAGSAVVTASRDGTVRVWDALFQPELDELARLGAPVTAVEFRGDKEIQATTQGGRTHLLDARTGEKHGVEPSVNPSAEVVGPDGTTARMRGNTVLLRDGGQTTRLEGHRDRVTSISFSPDGSLIATASRDYDVRVWDVATGEPMRVLHHNSAVRDVDFSPDGRWLVTAAGRAALWDLNTGLFVVRLQGHDGPFTTTGFDPSGRIIVSGGVDGTVRTYVCEICGGIDELVALAERRLAATGRVLTPAERERYLG